jgi:hypothetical protein
MQVYHCRRAETKGEFERLYGKRLWQADPALYGFVTKVAQAPFWKPLYVSRPPASARHFGG